MIPYSNLRLYVVLTELKESQHLALATFVFSDSLSSRTSQTAPLAEHVRIPDNCTARSLPTTPNVLAPISQDTSLAFSVPYDEVSGFLGAVQEIRGEAPGDDGREEKMWIMKAARSNGPGAPGSLRSWFNDAWISFLDLLKVRTSYLTGWHLYSRVSARGNSRYRNHGAWLYLHALDLRVSVPSDETLGIELLVSDLGTLFFHLCVFVWPYCHHKTWSSDKHGPPLRRTSLPCGHNWLRKVHNSYEGRPVSVAGLPTTVTSEETGKWICR
jgi:hypothetical protein